jgi:hypothetical protein
MRTAVRLITLSLATQLACHAALAQGPSKPNLPDIVVPAGYEEGYVPKLSDIDVKEVEKFAKNSSGDLQDLLDLVGKIPDYWEKLEQLKAGIATVIDHSKPLKTELLMRNVLERAVIIVGVIDAEVDHDIKRIGVVDQEVRLFKESILMAKGYWQPYLKAINGEAVQANVDLAKIDYKDFGIKYSALLMSIANSIFDASAEYRIRFEALKLLMWDLYRDENKLENGQAEAIVKLNTFIKSSPSTSGWTDDQYVERTKLLRAIYRESLDRMKAQSAPKVSGAGDPNAPDSQDGASKNYKSATQTDDGRWIISEPSFRVSPTQNLPLSYYQTSHDGICMLYGFGPGVQGAIETGSSANGVRINANGKFLGYDSDPHIRTIMCSGSGKDPKMNTHYESKSRNDDGSYTLVRPWFMGADQAHLPFTNYQTSNDGICKLYGFTKSVRESVITGSSAAGVRINTEGKFIGYDSDPQITSIMCTND